MGTYVIKCFTYFVQTQMIHVLVSCVIQLEYLLINSRSDLINYKICMRIIDQYQTFIKRSELHSNIWTSSTTHSLGCSSVDSFHPTHSLGVGINWNPLNKKANRRVKIHVVYKTVTNALTCNFFNLSKRRPLETRTSSDDVLLAMDKRCFVPVHLQNRNNLHDMILRH